MPHPPRLITHAGETLTLEEWAARARLPANTLRSRLDKQGWAFERAVSTPLDRRFGRRGKKRPAGVPRPCPEMKRTRAGRAYATWYAGEKQHYRWFGQWATPEATAAYQRFAAEWAAGLSLKPSAGPGGVSVAALAEAFTAHAFATYRKDGRPTSHCHTVKAALRSLNELFGDRAAAEFEPDDLRAYVGHLVAVKKLSLRTVNLYQWAAVRMFAWAAGRKLVPPGVVHALQLVERQTPGRSAAPEPEPTTSVPPERIEAILPHLHPRPAAAAVYAAMIRLQLASGMRPGEVAALRVRDLDRTRDVWRYEPAKVNKNRHRGQRRVVWLGPRAQAALGPLLDGLGPDDRVFAYPRKKGGPRVAVTADLLRERVAAACERAGVPHWHPHQLRHNRATEVQRRYESDEATRIAIGDTPEVARQIYVDDPAEAAAKRIARETG